LVVKASVSTTASNGFVMSINGSSANFTYRLLEGDGATAASYSGSTGRVAYAFNSTSIFSNLEVYIPNYTSANNKSFSVDGVSEQNATTAYADLTAGLWSQTAAITSLGFNFSAGNLQPNSTFYLYGVAKLGTTPAIVPYATGGDTIMTDGTYWYHAFLSSGTFTPAKGLSCDVVVVAGGGGGGQHAGGGGGAGGLLAFASQSVSTATTVTIGAGGAGSSTTARGTNGVDSQFGALTLVKGGGGGGSQGGTTTGATGGSGGGGTFTGNAGGSATSGQGNAGGTGSTVTGTGGGGGGAGAAGSTPTVAGTGTGGLGSNTYSTWASTTGTGVSGYYAGGGGGGHNGAGTRSLGSNGGGTGANTTNAATSGTANTGSGGGGGCDPGILPNGASGGSGLVIVRYAV
jgi:hypothetical protein